MNASTNTALPRSKAVLFCHEEARQENELLKRWLNEFCDVVGIVVIREDTSYMLLKRIRNELRRSGLLGLLDVFAFRIYYKLFRARKDATLIDAVFSSANGRYPAAPASTPTIVVSSPNSIETETFIRASQCDFAIARCKHILKRNIFSIPKFGIFVFHPGHCPEYRNAHGCFWALAQRQPELVSLTVLKVDAGVDTGPVYGFFTYKFDALVESHVLIQLRVLTENLSKIRALLQNIFAGQSLPCDVTDAPSGVWGQPKLSAYISYLRYYKQHRSLLKSR